MILTKLPIQAEAIVASAFLLAYWKDRIWSRPTTFPNTDRSNQAMPTHNNIARAALTVLTAFIMLNSSLTLAQTKGVFQDGPLIHGFGKIAKVDADFRIPKNMLLKVRFDVAKQATKGELNSAFDSAARLINLHADQGIKPENLQIAIVIHGKAILDVTTQDFYGLQMDGAKQGSIQAIRKLHQNGVKFILCGQTAAFYKAGKSDLLPVIKVAPSAMTAHAILAKEGYSLNPF